MLDKWNNKIFILINLKLNLFYAGGTFSFLVVLTFFNLFTSFVDAKEVGNNKVL